jgi:hypothetical protein
MWAAIHNKKFHKDCLENLKLIHKEVKYLRTVIISTWRLEEKYIERMNEIFSGKFYFK